MALFAGPRYPENLAGIMGLSCYLVLAARFDAERAPANQATPIFLAHGTQDPVVAPALGEEARRPLAGGRLCGGMAYVQHASLGVPARSRRHRRVAAARALVSGTLPKERGRLVVAASCIALAGELGLVAVVLVRITRLPA